MKIEITITYCISTTVKVPAALAFDEKAGTYPDRKAFEAFVSGEADRLAKEAPISKNDWIRTEAHDTKSWNEVYSVS
jgi:hypothetical protein